MDLIRRIGLEDADRATVAAELGITRGAFGVRLPSEQNGKTGQLNDGLKFGICPRPDLPPSIRYPLTPKNHPIL